MIYNKKYNLNNSNFLLNRKDIKYKPKKPITKIKADAPFLVKKIYKN